MTLPATSSSALRTEISALTDKGVKRHANEDAYGLFDLPGVDVSFVVADGMGGLQAGDVAAEESVKVMEAALRERLTQGDSARDALTEAFRRANERVFSIAEEVRAASKNASRKSNDEFSTERRRDLSRTAATPPPAAPLMGATVVAGLLQGDKLTIAYAGDSRVYRLRGGEIEALTFDHSFVAERVRAGDITEAEARVSRFRNMITRAVGIEENVQPEFREEIVRPGDLILACTDGLNTMLDDDEIAQVLIDPPLPPSPNGKQPSKRVELPITSERIATALIAAANASGGSDNITAVVLRTSDANGAPPAEPTPAAAPKSSAAERQAEPAPAAADRRSTKRPTVVDMDAARPSRRRGGMSPVVVLLAVVGVAAIGFATLLLASPSLRVRVASRLAPPVAPPPTPAPTALNGADDNTIHIRDFSTLTYKSAVKFGTPIFAARGDLLSYSPKAGLFFVKDSSGQMAYLSPKGEVERALVQFAIPPSVSEPVPQSRVFFTTDLQGNSYISYAAKKKIEKYAPDGRLLQTITGFRRPDAVAVDENGNLFVIDFNQILKLEAVEQPAAKTASP